MPKLATSVYPKSGLGGMDALSVTVNIGMLAVLYTGLGALMSFGFYYLFDEYEPGLNKNLEWEKKGLRYQVTDLVIEIVLVAVSSFWIVFLVNENFPIIPVRSYYAPFIDTYSTGLFFMYTVFIFVDSFAYKLQYVIQHLFGPIFDKYLPDSGSIVDLSLHWSSKKDKEAGTYRDTSQLNSTSTP